MPSDPGGVSNCHEDVPLLAEVESSAFLSLLQDSKKGGGVG